MQRLLGALQSSARSALPSCLCHVLWQSDQNISSWIRCSDLRNVTQYDWFILLAPTPPLLFNISKSPFFVFLRSAETHSGRSPLFGLSEREMDVCAYWTVKGHSSGDTLIQPNIHEYLGDGNEGVLHCCMRMEGAPQRRRRKRARTGRRGVARVCVSSVCLYVRGYLVKRHSCLIILFHSLACSRTRTRRDELDLLLALLNHLV